MKKKIFNIIAVLALVVSFVLPALVSQDVWADTISDYCHNNNNWNASVESDSSGTHCVKYAKSSSSCPDGWTFKAGGTTGRSRCIGPTITSSQTLGGQSSKSANNDDDSSSGSGSDSSGSGTSKTAGSTSASSATESSPDQMKKTGDCGEGEVYVSILGGGNKCVKIENDGSNIFSILNVILTVLTYGVGIAGTLGIVISGIQYLTARDNESQMIKAKSRLVNIVIGLVAYALLWAFLQWLIPGGIL